MNGGEKTLAGSIDISRRVCSCLRTMRRCSGGSCNAGYQEASDSQRRQRRSDPRHTRTAARLQPTPYVSSAPEPSTTDDQLRHAASLQSQQHLHLQYHHQPPSMIRPQRTDTFTHALEIHSLVRTSFDIHNHEEVPRLFHSGIVEALLSLMSRIIQHAADLISYWSRVAIRYSIKKSLITIL